MGAGAVISGWGTSCPSSFKAGALHAGLTGLGLARLDLAWLGLDGWLSSGLSWLVGPGCLLGMPTAKQVVLNSEDLCYINKFISSRSTATFDRCVNILKADTIAPR